MTANTTGFDEVEVVIVGAWINMTLVEKYFDTDEAQNLVTQGQRDEYHG